jgi:hypothetical protein
MNDSTRFAKILMERLEISGVAPQPEFDERAFQFTSPRGNVRLGAWSDRYYAATDGAGRRNVLEEFLQQWRALQGAD